MGTYYGSTLNVKLKPNTPEVLMEYFRLLASMGFQRPSTEDEYAENLTKMREARRSIKKNLPEFDVKDGFFFMNGSVSFDRWYGVTLEPLEDGFHRLITLSSSKSLAYDTLEDHLVYLLPYIEKEPGKIFFRSLRESFEQEDVCLWSHGERMGLLDGVATLPGHLYRDEKEDPHHPEYYFWVFGREEDKKNRELSFAEEVTLYNSTQLYMPSWDLNDFKPGNTKPPTPFPPVKETTNE